MQLTISNFLLCFFMKEFLIFRICKLPLEIQEAFLGFAFPKI